MGSGAVVAAVVAVVLVIVLTAGSGGSGPDLYLALGDSLSVGIQPNAKGQQLKTDAGYTNGIRSSSTDHFKQLKLIELGCPGDTTTSLLTGAGNSSAAAAYHCDRAGGSQLSAALTFIRAHRAQVKLVSLDIGANDLVGCADPAIAGAGISNLVACVSRAEQAVAANLPKILDPLRSALAPGTLLVNGTIYDPFLVGYLSPMAKLKEIAAASVGVLRHFNQEITAADRAAGVETADVAGTFFTYDTNETATTLFGQKMLPKDLVVLCSFTYLCTAKPQGPNIHPNSVGYRAMAGAYEKQL